MLFLFVLSACHGIDIFSGQQAYETCKAILSFGPRPSGSKNLERVKNYIKTRLSKNGIRITEDNFLSSTPIGKIQMTNISGHIEGSGKTGKKIIIAAHYESKFFKDFTFQGANDNASGTAVLLELAEILKTKKYKDDLELLFLDGEEAFNAWSINDGLYGSKRYVSQIEKPENIRALILLDMIGKKNVKIDFEGFSNPKLTELLTRAAKETGNEQSLSYSTIFVEDDHVPFLAKGIPAIDIIDFSFPQWHTKDDDINIISSESLKKIGIIVLKMTDLINENIR